MNRWQHIEIWGAAWSSYNK